MGYIDFMLVSFHQTILKKIIKEQLNIFKKIVKLHNSYDLCQDISKLPTSLEINMIIFKERFVKDKKSKCVGK